MRRFLLGAVFLLLTATSALALHFPALTGRVVDDAHILSPQTQQSLEAALANYEAQTTNQIVVVTLPSLEGSTIDDYGYQLGRAWGIGQKGKDNGALLIVAPVERKVRIEVGYGLEGTLTDAASHQIIQNIILPDFRNGNMEFGIVEGTKGIITALGGDADFTGALTSAAVAHPQQQLTSSDSAHFLFIFLVIVFIIFRLFILPWWFPTFWPLGGSGGFGSGGGFGGGFSGGGGSFGGGGASGGW